MEQTDSRLFYINLDKITVKERSRKDLGLIGELAESIKKLGLLQPLVLEDNLELRAGARRLAAVRLLGWSTVPCILLSSLTPLERLEIELEENIKRKNFEWQEEVRLKEEISQLRAKASPGVTLEQTAQKMGISESGLKADLQLARAVREWPELHKEPDKSNALNKAKRLIEKKLRTLQVSINTTLGPVQVTDNLGPLSNIKLYKQAGVTLFLQDCVEGLKTIPDSSIDLLLTDYPYGVGLDKAYGFQKSWDEVYNDSADYVLQHLLPATTPEIARVLKPGAHFYIFFPSLHQQAFYDQFSKYLTVQKVPLIWNKVFGGSNYRPYSNYTPNYEPLWFGYKGQEPRKLAVPGFCVLTYTNLAGQQKTHPAEKPFPLIKYLMEQSSLSGETVLELFAGSGVVLEAALRLGRKALGFELSERWFDVVVERLENAKNGKESNPD